MPGTDPIPIGRRVQQLLGHAYLDHTDTRDADPAILEEGFARAHSVARIINVMTMTAEQFDLLSQVVRSREPVTSGARLVLLHGVPNAEAAKVVGASPQSVHRSAKSLMEWHEKFVTAYQRPIASSSRR